MFCGLEDTSVGVAASFASMLAGRADIPLHMSGSDIATFARTFLVVGSVRWGLTTFRHFTFLSSCARISYRHLLNETLWPPWPGCLLPSLWGATHGLWPTSSSPVLRSWKASCHTPY